MAQNLDKSLDEILATNKPVRSARGRAGRAAPAGGVTKRSARVQQQQQQQKATVPARASNKADAKTGNATKMIVSNLPYDITDAMIKEYFGKMVGNVKRATVTYGPNGVSRGIATIEFSKAGDANDAFARYNGTTVDGRPMKIELVVDLSKPAEFADRVGAPKGQNAKHAPATSKAKPVTATNTSRSGAKDTRGAGRQAGRGRDTRRGRGAASEPRPKKTTKTAAELDAEMADYFTGSTAEGNENAAPVQSAAADLDEDAAM